MSSVQKILNNNKVNSGVEYTHLSLAGNKGTYFLGKKAKYLLMNIYNRDIRLTSNKYYIAEHPYQNTQLVFDIDIKQKIKKNDTSDSKIIYDTEEDIDNKLHDLYTIKQVEDLIKIIKSVLIKYLEEYDDSKLLVVYLNKKPYRKDGYVKNGFHLQYPNLFLNKENCIQFIYPKIRELVKKNNLFKSVKSDFCSNDPKDYEYEIDNAGMTNAWLLYGSRKNPDSDPYKMKSIYNSNDQKISLLNAFKNYNLYDLKNNVIPLKDENTIFRNLPNILSIHVNSRSPTTIKMNNIISNVQISQRSFCEHKNEDSIEDSKNNYSPDEIIDIIDKFIPMLSKKRSDNYNSWMEVGWCLYCITNGSIEGYNNWIQFSKKSSNFDERKCRETWSKMVNRGNYTIGTLKYFAKIDSPKKYNQIVYIQKQTTILNLVINGVVTECDIAKFLYDLYTDEYVCIDVKKQIWYHFYDHIWNIEPYGSSLRHKVSTELVTLIDKEIKKIDVKLNGLSANSTQRKTPEQTRKNLVKLKIQCKSTTFKNNVMREVAEYFEDKNNAFMSVLDKNGFVFGMQNGVYDFKADQFRDGKSTDYISKKCNAKYNNNFTVNHPKVKIIYKFLKQIHPDILLYNYFMYTTCLILIGGNFNKQITFWTGVGENGKSALQRLIERALKKGQYCVSFPTTLFTSKKPPNGSALPELSRAGNGIRWGIITEPEKDEVLQTSFLKKISGGDSIYCRGLYKEGREVTFQFKIVIICNDLPKIKHSDKAFWNRTKAIPFESKFTYEAPKSEAEQVRLKHFPRINNFEDDLSIDAFIWILINHWQQYVKNKPYIKEPAKVKMVTNAYKKSNDNCLIYIEENIISNDMIDKKEPEMKISLNELYSSYKYWHKESVGKSHIPVKNDIKEAFKKIWGPHDDNALFWKGYRIRKASDSNIIIKQYRQ